MGAEDTQWLDIAHADAYRDAFTAYAATISLSSRHLMFSVNVVFQDQPPATEGNKLNMHRKKNKKNSMAKFKAPGGSLYVSLNHGKTQPGMPSASCSPCFAG